MAKPGRLEIDHEDSLANLATWWKAIFLTPCWAFLVIMPFGAMVRTYWPAYDLAGYFLILSLGLIYFARDMAKRRIVINDEKVQFGFSSAPISKLESIKVASYSIGFGVPLILPKSVRLTFEDGTTMSLMLSRLSDNQLVQLIDIISRRVSHCRIDSTVEDVLRRRRPVAVLRLANPDKFEAHYHGSRLLEELPVVLQKTVHNWARLIGPIGTFMLCAPLWLAFNLQIYRILRDYENVSANQTFYDQLAETLTKIIEIANNGLTTSSEVSFALAASPLVAILCICATAYLIFYLARSVMGANRLTIDRDEISLDRFFNLFSFTAKSAKWKDVEQVLLEQPKGTADPNQAEIIFKGKNGRPLTTLKLGCLAAQDREKLSMAIIKFSGESYVGCNLTEALEPSQERSYTELWLKSLTDAPGRKNLEPLMPGHLLENCRYEIDKKLAVGGEGVAYLGRDLKNLATGTIEKVVLKETLIPPFVDKDVQQRALERFEREARLLKELKSEYVVGLRDYFIEDHRCYLVLDYVEGKNLRQYIAEHGRLDETMVLSLAKQMCEMLEFLHERSVIHRDFTPDNLILQENGQLKLIDFNVARESDQGKTGTIVGKHAYVPPEQFRGKPTKQSDLYALGATLYFLLVGSDPEPISQSSPVVAQSDVSEAMDALVQKCTALDPTKRMGSVADLIAACTEIRQSRQTSIALLDMPPEEVLAEGRTISVGDDNIGGVLSVENPSIEVPVESLTISLPASADKQKKKQKKKSKVKTQLKEQAT